MLGFDYRPFVMGKHLPCERLFRKSFSLFRRDFSQDCGDFDRCSRDGCVLSLGSLCEPCRKLCVLLRLRALNRKGRKDTAKCAKKIELTLLALR
jgi:hypothetical protein